MDASHFLQASAFVQYVPVDDVINACRNLRANYPTGCYEYSLNGAKKLLEDLSSSSYILDCAEFPERHSRQLFLNQLFVSISKLSSDEVSIICAESDIHRVVKEVKHTVETSLNDIGVLLPNTKIYVVDSFPAPYHKRNYAALTLDSGDFEAYGTSPGIYILRNEYMPIFGRTLIFHEYIHTIFGDKDPLLIARGLEEGVCEVLGTILLTLKLLPSKIVINSFVYARLRKCQDPMWQMYLDMARQAADIYFQYGLEGFSKILNGGRKELKSVEEELYVELGDKLVDSNFYSNDSGKVLRQLLLRIPQQTVVSSVAYLLAKELRVGLTVREAASLLDVTSVVIEEAFSELEGPLRLCCRHQDGASVLFCDSSFNKSPYYLRYSVS